MTASATFASNIVSFCDELEEFWAFVHLLKGMSQRLSHCCIREIMPLMELPSVKQVCPFLTYACMPVMRMPGCLLKIRRCLFKVLYDTKENDWYILQNRAKQLYSAGYTNLQKIAKANPHDLVQNIEFMTHRVAGQLIAAAKVLYFYC